MMAVNITDIDLDEIAYVWVVHVADVAPDGAIKPHTRDPVGIKYW